jgi:diacylglycerol kinase family enzyme
VKPATRILVPVRAVLIVNPSATTTSPRSRDVLASALGDAAKLDVKPTQARGHARELAARAVADEVDVVVAFGGDGTVNEVVNGLVGDGSVPAEEIPALGLVPGGATNVFLRALGLPNDPVEATGSLLEAMRSVQTRTVGLGRVLTAAEDRLFIFAAGLGIDGGAVRRVEVRRNAGKRATYPLYVRQTLLEYFRATDRRRPPLTLEVDDHEAEAVFLALVTNTDPWTFLGDRPVRPTPQSSLDEGLDVFALKRFGTFRTLHHAAQLIRKGPHGRHVVLHHDAERIRVTAGRPSSLQIDGDYVGERTSATFRSVPRALRVLVPTEPDALEGAEH